MSPEFMFAVGIMLIPYALGWIILLIKPRWTFLFAFTAAMMVFGLPSFLAGPDPFVSALRLLLRGALFMALGGPIVALRLAIRNLPREAGNTQR